MPTIVKGFISKWDRDQHFEDHGHDFGGLTSADEYEAAAVAFFNKPLAGGMMEGVRLADGWIIRFDSNTDEFAICDVDGYLRTYFKPDPAIHGLPNNTEYFRRRCRS